MYGQSNSSVGYGLYGLANASTGTNYGVYGQTSSGSGIAGAFNNAAGGKIISGQNNGTEKFSVDGSGNVATAGAVLASLPNGSGGTTNGYLAKLDSNGSAVQAGATDTAGIVGIVVFGGGTTGDAQIALAGQANCVFDGGTTAGHYVQASAGTGGDCHDAGASYPGTGQVLGRVLSTNGGTGTYPVMLFGRSSERTRRMRRTSAARWRAT